jgi:acyl carrier protein
MDILNIIFEAIDIVNEQIIHGPKIEKSIDTIFLGQESDVDSLSFVNLIVAIEDLIERKTGSMISLVDEEVLSAEEQPLRSVKSIMMYIERKI